MSSIIASIKCEHFGYNLCLLYEIIEISKYTLGCFAYEFVPLERIRFNTKHRANRNLKLICPLIHAQYPFVFPRLAKPYTFVYPSDTKCR